MIRDVCMKKNIVQWYGALQVRYCESQHGLYPVIYGSGFEGFDSAILQTLKSNGRSRSREFEHLNRMA